MIGYVTLGTNDLPRAVAFYDALIGGMGGKRFMEHEGVFVAWVTDPKAAGLSVTKPFNGEPATVGNGVMVALDAPNPAEVDRLHALALSLGAIGFLHKPVTRPALLAALNACRAPQA